MKTNPIKNQNGVTLIEVLVASALLLVVMLGTLTLLSSTLDLWSKGASGAGANNYACIASKKLVMEIEEGKSASVVNGSLEVVFPYYDSVTGNYVRTATGSTVTYYLSGTSGTELSGTYLWKSVGGTKTRLARSVQSVTFSVTNGTLVRITLIGQDEAGGAISPNMVQQSVRLRNG